MSLIEVRIDGVRRWVSEGKGKCVELWVNGEKKFPSEKVSVVSVEWLKKRLKDSVDRCVVKLRDKNTEKGLCISKEDEIRIKQSLFLYKEWFVAVEREAKK